MTASANKSADIAVSIGQRLYFRRGEKVMGDFDAAFEKTLNAEGGYVHDPSDLGGETYKGVARSRNSKWAGWQIVDAHKGRGRFPDSLDNDEQLQELVKELYRTQYWDRVCGDDIQDQDIAESVFDFAVNAGPRTSMKLTQLAVDAEVDGVIGPNTLALLNDQDPRTFLAVFALAKIGRYAHLCEQRPENRRFFYGWVRRTLEGI